MLDQMYEVKNDTVDEHYGAYRTEMSRRLGALHINERDLFHGTSAVLGILNEGDDGNMR